MSEEQKKPAVLRDSKGRFLKGVSGNPRGRAPLPPEFRTFAAESPARLRAIADDPDTPVKLKAEIERWFTEMWYGKAPQALDLEGTLENSGKMVVEFKGELEEWSQ